MGLFVIQYKQPSLTDTLYRVKSFLCIYYFILQIKAGTIVMPTFE